MLFNPSTYDPTHLDPESRRALRALVEFFESKGKTAAEGRVPPGHVVHDFLDLVRRGGLFSRCGTPADVAALLPEPAADARWDTARINEMNEMLGFYSLSHWYAWQVSVLGLGPVWMSGNDDARALVGGLLDEGAIFGFGLSEQTHGADIYSTDMVLTPDAAGGWTASGAKYYIGNGNVGRRG